MDTARAPLSWLSGAGLGQCGADGRERHDLSPACVSRGPCPRCGVSRGGAAETWPTFPPALAVSGAEAAASPPAGPADVGGALADTAMGSRPCTRGTDPSWPWQPFLVRVPGCPVLAEKLPRLIQERCRSQFSSFLSSLPPFPLPPSFDFDIKILTCKVSWEVFSLCFLGEAVNFC